MLFELLNSIHQYNTLKIIKCHNMLCYETEKNKQFNPHGIT
jgi:hypothetical protein